MLKKVLEPVQQSGNTVLLLLRTWPVKLHTPVYISAKHFSLTPPRLRELQKAFKIQRNLDSDLRATPYLPQLTHYLASFRPSPALATPGTSVRFRDRLTKDKRSDSSPCLRFTISLVKPNGAWRHLKQWEKVSYSGEGHRFPFLPL